MSGGGRFIGGEPKLSDAGFAPRRWLEWFKTPTGRYITSLETPKLFEDRETTVLGGICSLFTADWERMRGGEVRFRDPYNFAAWLSSWYPRLDQVYGCVGIPPSGIQRIIYVVEDSFFAERLCSLYPGWDAADVSIIFREAHERQGRKAVLRWLREGGYQGEVTAVYTSDLGRELEIARRCFELSIGAALGSPHFRFPEPQRVQSAVKTMYTPFWSAVLGVSGPAFVYEPQSHGLASGDIKGLGEWSERHPYGDARGLCAFFGRIGFREFELRGEGPTRTARSCDRMLNRGNYRRALAALDGRQLWDVFERMVGRSAALEQSAEALQRILLIKLQAIME